MDKSLAADRKHFSTCHARWMKHRLRFIESAESKDEWFEEQCLRCRYFLPLQGAFALDYGVCSNAASPADGLVRFEHNGCSYFADGPWWEVLPQDV